MASSTRTRPNHHVTLGWPKMSTQQPYHLESNKIISDLVRILTTIVIVDSDSKPNAVCIDPLVPEACFGGKDPTADCRIISFEATNRFEALLKTRKRNVWPLVLSLIISRTLRALREEIFLQ